MRLPPEIVAWLLDSDPSIRWQVMQGLTDAAPEVVELERRRTTGSGWVKALLDLQDPDGRWAGALYSPKWTSTTYTLLLLDRLGLERGHPAAVRGCEVLWSHASVFGGGLTLAKTVREPETCITAMLVLLAVRHGHAASGLQAAVDWLIDQQLADGGWNCETIRSGSRHGSFHTSISVLEALAALPATTPIIQAADRGRDFFLDHQLYRSHRTGEIADAAFTRFPFPPQWHFDILRGLEHFAVSWAPQDVRLEDAIGVLNRARRTDGTWRRHRPWPGRYWFQLEPAGPSRWTTLRALRVLRWWDAIR